MTAHEVALKVDDESSDQQFALAVQMLAGGEQVVLLNGLLALRSFQDAIECEVVDPTPGSHRCAEEFKVLVENAGRMLWASKLGALLPGKPLRWLVVDDSGTSKVVLWREPPGASDG